MLSLHLKSKLDGISNCSAKGEHKVKNLFKILVNNLELWDWAHQSIASNKGATTRGIDDVTVDGHSDERVLALMESLKLGKYQFQPVRRTYIPKANGKKRPLGIPNYHDKLVQSACKILLEAIYEPIFHEHSYGFRPKRGCHDALHQISYTWTGTKWFIEFDIKGYFDNINHQKLMETLSEKIDDDRFLALIRKMLKAGYMEDWKYNKTYSGTPQGGVISPVLANIYLNKLDTHVERLCNQNSYGKKRERSLEGKRLYDRLTKLKKKISKIDPESFANKESWEEAKRQELLRYKDLQREIMGKRPMDDFDESFRRLKYCRYADDFVLGYIGSKEEAEGIMANIKSFLKEELLLEVSEEKTKIESHKTGIRFLGYDIHSSPTGEYFKKTIVNGAPSYKRYGTTKIYLYAPWDKLKEFCKSRSYGDWTNPVRSKHRPYLTNLSDAEILSTYNSEIRGMFQYYKLAHDYSKAFWRFHYLADYSCRKTLANKHKSSVKKISKAYVKRGPKGDKRLTVFVERNGRTYRLAKPNDIDRIYKHWEKERDEYDYDTITQYFADLNDLTKRRKKEICESCGVKTAFVEEHHIRALKDIRKSAKWWEKRMIARNRKTMILCIPCHDQLHAGILPDMRAIKKKKQEYFTGVEH